MLTSRKIAVALLAACLAGGVLAAPAAARKKPLRSASQTFYFVQLGSESCAPEGQALSITPVSENRGQCLSAAAGPVNEVYETTTGCEVTAQDNDPCNGYVYPAANGLPLTLDARRPVTGTVHVANVDPAGLPVSAGAGAATFHLTLRGKIDGVTHLLGTFSADYVVTPAQTVYDIPVEIELDPALARSTLSSLSATVWNSGITAGHGVVKQDTSNLVLPVLR